MEKAYQGIGLGRHGKFTEGLTDRSRDDKSINNRRYCKILELAYIFGLFRKFREFYLTGKNSF